MTSADRRRAARANFRSPPAFWTELSGDVYEARCINISNAGISIRVRGDLTNIEPGQKIETVLTAPRLCVVASGHVVRAQADGKHSIIAAQFENPPEEIADLINTAISCIDEEFSAGVINHKQAHLEAVGAFSGANAGDLRYSINGHQTIDMQDVREIDQAGIDLLAAANQQHLLMLINCKPQVAIAIRSNQGKGLCSSECAQCPVDS